MSSNEEPREAAEAGPGDDPVAEYMASASILQRRWKDVLVPKVSRAARQPVGLKTLSGLTAAGSKYYAVQSKYSSQMARIKLQFRELDKMKAAIDKIAFKEVEEPGVVPRMFGKLEEAMVRFNAEEQPRIERIMDSVDGNLTESRGILNKVNTSLGNLLGLASQHSLLIKVALAICGGGIVLTLILIPLVLIKILIFGL
ncbi:MAG: hypothetical protein JTT11_05400 [Candidatus Brockarchaeota archaeon]|nr:hypothetical protein [Candidatus Brockarchaeota archaeon]